MVINSPAARRLPHAAPMPPLDKLIAVDDEQVHCQVSTCAGGVLTPFLTPQGELPAWFGVEMMAQTVGVLVGLACEAGRRHPYPARHAAGRHAAGGQSDPSSRQCYAGYQNDAADAR